jgi:hypothetical protein
MLRGPLILLLVSALAAPAAAIEPDASGNYNIMKPEPGSRPAKHNRAPAREEETAPSKGFGVKQDTRRGSSNPVYPAPLPGPQAPAAVPRIERPSRRATVPPPPLFVPETGRALPNLPAVGAAPETSQDKSVRCAHQAGVYGPSATGNPAGYIGSCINQ